MLVDKAVDGLKRGCRNCWESLYREFSQGMTNVASTILEDREEAEDVVQQLFTRLPRTIQNFNPTIGDFKGWLYAAVKFNSRNRLDEMARHKRLDDLCRAKLVADRLYQQELHSRIVEALTPDNARIVEEFLTGELPRDLKRKHKRKPYFRAMQALKKEMVG